MIQLRSFSLQKYLSAINEAVIRIFVLQAGFTGIGTRGKCVVFGYAGDPLKYNNF